MTGLTTGTIARLLGAELVGRGDLTISGVDAVERAREGALTFIRTSAWGARWAACKASAAIITRGVPAPGHDPSRRALLVVDDADAAMFRLLGALAPPEDRPAPGVHATALVDPSARIGAGVAIGPLCIVGPGAVIGDGTALIARVTLGRDVRIGRACTLQAGVVIQDRCVLGDACLLHPGVVIGADGFGYAPAPDGRGMVKIPHIGNVQIGDDVEIGANSCIDRAKIGSTTVGSGTKIDNLVQVGHGAKIGRGCMLCGQVGIAGSAILEDGVVMGGQSGVADNLTVYAGSRVGAGSAVNRQPDGPGELLGYPAGPARQVGRLWRTWEKLPELIARLRELEKRVESLDGRAPSAEPSESTP